MSVFIWRACALFIGTWIVSIALTSYASPIETFDGPITTAATQAPGVWYTDRYAPADFTSAVSGGGRTGVLRHSISSADRPDQRGGQSSAFYNTQGRKLDLAGGTTSMSIDLFVTNDAPDQRFAGFWGTAVDATDTITAYPILEFTSDIDGSGGDGFRGWNGTGWTDMGLPTGFSYDEWYTLGIELDGSDFVYTVGDLMLNVDANGSVAIDNTILQGHNTTGGSDYDILWDNLASPSLAAVPEPASLSLWSLLCIAAFGWRRRRNLRLKCQNA